MFVEPLFIMGTVLEEWAQFYTYVKMITDSQSYSIFHKQVLNVLILFCNFQMYAMIVFFFLIRKKH